MSVDFSDYDRYKVTVEVDRFTAEYAGCGSHHIELELDTNRVSLAPLYQQLRAIFVENVLDSEGSCP